MYKKLNFFTCGALKNAKESLKNREKFLSFDELGRSLSYNPFLPRARLEDFARGCDQEVANKTLVITPLEQDIAKVIDFPSRAVLVDFIPLYEKATLAQESFDRLAQLRRYTQKLIIHSDIFLKPYQLLESAIYGSDCVLLDACMKDIGKMCEFALRLGLLPIVKVTSASELKRAIFAKFEMIYIAQNFSTLLSMVPNSKIIFADLAVEEVLDKEKSYGVDVFFSYC